MGGIQGTDELWELLDLAKPDFKDDLVAAKAFLATVSSKRQNGVRERISSRLFIRMTSIASGSQVNISRHSANSGMVISNTGSGSACLRPGFSMAP